MSPNWLTSPRKLIPTCETKKTSKNSKERSSGFGTNCRWMIKFSKWGLANRWTATVNGQNNLSKTQNLITVAAYDYKGLRVIAYPRCTPLMGSKMIHVPLEQIRWRSTLTDSRRWLISTIPVDSERILTWDHFHWLSYEIIIPFTCGSSKTECECVLGD
jgi:hypothetical protein